MTWFGIFFAVLIGLTIAAWIVTIHLIGIDRGWWKENGSNQSERTDRRTQIRAWLGKTLRKGND
jgi:hypothetical protein